MLHLGQECYTFPMPTRRPRHMITETDAVSEYLSLAAEMWPEAKDDRALLLRRLLELGAGQIRSKIEAGNQERLTAVKLAAGLMSDVWPENWRDERDQDWPA